MNLSRRLDDLERQASRRTAKPTAPAVPFDYERFAELYRAIKEYAATGGSSSADDPQAELKIARPTGRATRGA